MFFRNARRFGRKAFRAVKRGLRKRYTTKRRKGPRKINVSQIAKDVITLKQLVNVEKKRFNIVLNSQGIGQVNLNANGYYSADITPVMSEGLQYNQRNGSSIKIVSFYHRFQFWQQTNNIHKTRLQIDYFIVKGAPQTASTFASDYFNTDPNSGVLDYNSLKDPDYFGQAKLICSKKVTVAPRFQNENAIVDVCIPRKLQHHVRFNDDTNTVVDGQIIMVMRADSGNASATISTTSNIPIVTALSGLTFNYNLMYYYVDN